jgi:hypothetical protein
VTDEFTDLSRTEHRDADQDRCLDALSGSWPTANCAPPPGRSTKPARLPLRKCGGHIALLRELCERCCPPRSLSSAEQGLCLLPVPTVARRHRGSLSHQAVADRCTDAARSSGHERDSSIRFCRRQSALRQIRRPASSKGLQTWILLLRTHRVRSRDAAHPAASHTPSQREHETDAA